MSSRAIIEAIRKINGQYRADEVTYTDAEVQSVDIASRTCVCIALFGNAEYELPNVKLMADIDDGILIEPIIGSTVKVIFSEKVEPFICQYSEIENITIDAKTKIKFNDGSFGGIVKAGDITSKINTIEDDLNAIKNVFKSWVVVPNDGGAALKTASTTWANQAITKTTVSEISNSKVQHGE